MRLTPFIEIWAVYTVAFPPYENKNIINEIKSK